MQTLAFDGRMGASGDMLLGALIAAGADPDALSPVEQRLAVVYDIGTTTRCGITATTVTVHRTDGTEHGSPSEKHHHGGEDEHDHGERGEHHHGGKDEHDHDERGEHHHGGEDEHDHDEGGPHRTLAEVLAIVDSLDVPATVRAEASSIFEGLAAAEAAVHGTDPAETQFHEVGADDAIADVVGVCLLLADLDPDRVVTTPLSTGSGTVEMSHGSYPVPAPAVVELAATADWSLRGGPVEAELLTPTGAAVLAQIATGVESLPGLRVEESGYGAGTRTFERHPNVLRALVGESTGDLRREPVTVLETNLDDAAPELLGGLQERLVDAGALDVAVVPMTMKKSRPGHLVKVVVAPENARQVARRLAEETGTLGVREHGSGHRLVADRERRPVTVTVDGRPFDVEVKVASIDGTVYDISAEFDDALAVARETERSVREVCRRAERAVRDGNKRS